MNPLLYDRIALAVIASGLMLAGITWALLGGRAAVGALVGAGVATTNWLIIRYLAKTVAANQGVAGQENADKRKGTLVLLGFKTLALMVLCWVLVTAGGVDPKGFMIGIGALVLGVVIGPALTPKSPPTPDDQVPDDVPDDVTSADDNGAVEKQ